MKNCFYLKDRLGIVEISFDYKDYNIVCNSHENDINHCDYSNHSLYYTAIQVIYKSISKNDSSVYLTFYMCLYQENLELQQKFYMNELPQINAINQTN
jgi:hypothetical protein